MKGSADIKKTEMWRKGISCELYLYLMFFVTANLIDWIIVLSDGAKTENYQLVLFIIFVLMTALTKVGLKKRKIILWRMVSKEDLIPLVLLMFLSLIRITIPDASYDTLNYHLFWQESLGQDIVQYHFFPTRVINSLYFCMGDRTYFIFRTLLGYRGGGVAWNTFINAHIFTGKVFFAKGLYCYHRAGT